VVVGIAVLVLAALVIPLSSERVASAQSLSLQGKVVTGGGAPLASFDVTLFAASANGGPPSSLGSAVSAVDGTFDISYETPGSGTVLYLVAKNTVPPPAPGSVTLASVLGAVPVPGDVVVNELTTVASGYAMAQFTANGEISGTSPGLQNAAGMAQNLVDVATGGVSSVLASPPNGNDTSAPNTFNSLANMVEACVAAPAQCAALFAAATPPGGPAPTDTFQSVVDIARNPGNNVGALFALSTLPPATYQPARSAPPDAWTLALRFVGDGASMSGPGNMAIDHDGNVWVTTNYEYSANPLQPVCGSKLLVRFTPTGRYVPGSPYTGGGLSGAGFGIDIDPFGDVWVGNFGFAAPPPLCPDDKQPPHNSVSQFSADGTPKSPKDGFTQGGISWPQGTVSDQQGNIWIANCNGDSVTRFPDGDPSRAEEIRNMGIEKPFDIAKNNAGDMFVTGVGNSAVAVLHPDGSPAANSPITGGGLQRPLGIAADSGGNMWVANSGLVDIPCPQRADATSPGGSITSISSSGQLLSPTAFTGGGLTLPWGIAVDGNDNVWVANFAGKRLSEFCGLKPANCPPGSSPGDAISPNAGYSFDGLVRNTGVAIDPSGNVWVANNWKEVPPEANPGGYEMVVYVGAAGPVKRPAPRTRPAVAAPRFTG
jgi:sugar lactone lactonase YvrE